MGIIKHSSLFSLDTKGKIREWYIEQDGSNYRMVSGLSDGEKVTSKWTTAIAKNVGRSNHLTPEQQVVAEIISKYKLKADKGYRYNVYDLHGDDLFVTPMLAKKYGEVDFSFPVYSQPKLDGMRCVVSKGGMCSRNGKPIYSAPHISKSLEEFFKGNPGVQLDGELFCDKLKDNFNKIISLAKKQTFTVDDLKESEQYLQYWVYDMIDTNSKFSDRFDFISSKLSGLDGIVVVPTAFINSPQELDLIYQQYLADGQEGQMIRIDEVYENKRSKFLLKRKEFIDDEFEIVDITEGKGNRSGMFGRAKLKTNSGLEFESNARGNEEFYIDLLKNKDLYIGKKATVRYQNITPDGIPRFGVILAIRDYE